MAVLVEINSKQNGAFTFKTFKGGNSLSMAKHFCETLSKKCSTLKAVIVKSN